MQNQAPICAPLARLPRKRFMNGWLLQSLRIEVRLLYGRRIRIVIRRGVACDSRRAVPPCEPIEGGSACDIHYLDYRRVGVRSALRPIRVALESRVRRLRARKVVVDVIGAPIIAVSVIVSDYRRDHRHFPFSRGKRYRILRISLRGVRHRNRSGSTDRPFDVIGLRRTGVEFENRVHEPVPRCRRNSGTRIRAVGGSESGGKGGVRNRNDHERRGERDGGEDRFLRGFRIFGKIHGRKSYLTGH